jgi:uncharacterized membrane protein YjjP (DUF1212 family)
MQWLTLLSFAIPELLAMGVALAMLAGNARPGPGRRLGLIGISAMVAAALAGTALSVVQGIVLQNAGGDLQRMLGVMTSVRVLLHIVSLAGLLTVVWGLCRATRADDAR